MNFETLQQSWKTQSIPAARDAAETLQRVHAHSRAFRRKVFWRDFREVGASLINVVIFSLIATFSNEGGAWGAWGMVAASVFVALFFLVDRLLQARRPQEPGDDLATGLRTALEELDHQIWLLRHVAWWYLAPFGLGVMGWALGLSWASPLMAFFWFPAFGLIFGMASVSIHRLNQKEVRETLQPEREALARELEEWTSASSAHT